MGLIGSNNGHARFISLVSARWFRTMEETVRTVHQLPSHALAYRISRAKKRYGAEYKVHEGLPDIIAVSRYNDTPHLSYAHEAGILLTDAA